MIETIAELGEIEVLNRLKEFMDNGQIDDDTALVEELTKKLLINTDLLVEDVHFSSQTSSPEDIGWKAITTNLSDLAASGAHQFLYITVGLVAPPSTQWKWVEGVYKGMTEALQKFGGKIIGGDCSKGEQKIISITAIGTLGILRLHRSFALPGDYLLTSGPHGLSKLGLELLTSKDDKKLGKVQSSLKMQAINAHQRPNPPIKALKKLEGCKPIHLPWRAAGTDSSDGLIEAIKGICTSSRCQAIIDPLSLPRPFEWPKGDQWDNWCLAGGEDYQLVVSLPEEWANAWLKTMPSAKKIGKIRKGNPQVYWENGKAINLSCQGFKHY